MPLTRLHQKSDIEKRLKILHQQLYGKQSEQPEQLRKTQTISNFEPAGSPSHSGSSRSDIIYLHHDLLKISILSALALGSQIVLFLALENNLIKLPTF